MTDDDNAGWNAAKNVFGSDLRHFLCIWHVHKNWHLKIQQYIKDKEQQAEIYCLLCAAMDAKTETLYNKYIPRSFSAEIIMHKSRFPPVF